MLKNVMFGESPRGVGWTGRRGELGLKISQNVVLRDFESQSCPCVARLRLNISQNHVLIDFDAQFTPSPLRPPLGLSSKYQDQLAYWAPN